MDIKVLGTGCPNCKTLELTTRKAIEELEIQARVEKIENIQKIMEYGILRTPGLVINGKVIFSGKIPSLEDLKKLITQVK